MNKYLCIIAVFFHCLAWAMENSSLESISPYGFETIHPSKVRFIFQGGLGQINKDSPYDYLATYPLYPCIALCLSSTDLHILIHADSLLDYESLGEIIKTKFLTNKKKKNLNAVIYSRKMPDGDFVEYQKEYDKKSQAEVLIALRKKLINLGISMSDIKVVLNESSLMEHSDVKMRSLAIKRDGGVCHFDATAHNYFNLEGWDLLSPLNHISLVGDYVTKIQGDRTGSVQKNLGKGKSRDQILRMKFKPYGTGADGFPSSWPTFQECHNGCYKEANFQCSGCKKVRYCSDACQRAHWRKIHKNSCSAKANK